MHQAIVVGIAAGAILLHQCSYGVLDLVGIGYAHTRHIRLLGQAVEVLVGCPVQFVRTDGILILLEHLHAVVRAVCPLKGSTHQGVQVLPSA